MNPKTNSGSTPDSQLRSGLSNGPPTRRGTLLGIVRWCIAHRGRVVVAWVAVAVLTTVVRGRSGATTPPTSPCPERSPSGRSTCSRRSSRRRAATSTRSCSTSRSGTIDSPAVRGRDHAGAGAGQRRSRTSSRASISPYSRERSGPGLARPEDRVRDDQLRKARQPAAEQRRQAAARSGQSGARAGPAGRRGRSGDRERRGLQRRPGDGDRSDRGAGDPAAHVRLADRGRDAADHRRPRPDHAGWR